MSPTLVSYVLKAAVRDRIILSFFFILVVALSISMFLGSSAVTEKDQFAFVFLSSSLRIAGALGLVMFVIFYIRRAFDTKDVEYQLSRPVSRVSYIVSHAAAFSILALLIGGLVSGIVLAASIDYFSEAHLLWALSLLVEYTVMVNVALFFSMVLPSAPAGAIVTLAFYVLARMIGQLLGTAEATGGVEIMEVLAVLMNIISIIVPRLDLMAQSSWLVYGEVALSDVLFVVAQGLVFVFLVVLASIVDLVRKQF